jgi:hypothetical protein
VKRLIGRVGVVVLVVALAAAGAALAAKPKVGPPPPKLFGAVGKTAKQISLTNGQGHSVLRLKPGWYTLTISDRSASQRFRLLGPGINRSTGGPFVGAAIWGVHLRKGTYRYQTVGKATASRRFSVA